MIKILYLGLVSMAIAMEEHIVFLRNPQIDQSTTQEESYVNFNKNLSILEFVVSELGKDITQSSYEKSDKLKAIKKTLQPLNILLKGNHEEKDSTH